MEHGLTRIGLIFTDKARFINAKVAEELCGIMEHGLTRIGLIFTDKARFINAKVAESAENNFFQLRARAFLTTRVHRGYLDY